MQERVSHERTSMNREKTSLEGHADNSPCVSMDPGFSVM